VSIVCLTLAVAIELNRENPLVDVYWLTSREVVHFAAALLMFRLALSEQSSVASNLFQVMGLQNDQLATLYIIMILASVAAGFICANVLEPGREPVIHAVALGLLFIGSYLDSFVTNVTRPPQMYLSQAMIAAAGALFLPSAMAAGLTSALKKGPNYILSFFVVFLVTQNIGGLLGSAVLQTFATLREQFHSNVLAERITLANPFVVQRVAQLTGVYGHMLLDNRLLSAEGLAMLTTQVTREATILAYGDAFLLIAVGSLLALVALLVHMAFLYLRRPSIAAAPVPD
jgi:hypothetical protein